MASTTIFNAEPDRKRLILSIRLATLVVRAALVDSLFRKAGFRPDQSRIPAGVREGGQWVDEDGDADLILVSGDPNEFPDIPEEPPPNTRDRNMSAIRVARFLLATNDAVRADAIHRWVWEYARDRIIAYLDEPKFLDQLRRAVNEPKPGYDIHHIVEQTPARQDGFSRDQIEGWRNLVRIPTYRHWQITGWYATPNVEYDNLSPRAYLRGKSWQERYEVGLDALRIFGVLK